MVFSTLSQSFAFHSSPEAFISNRLQDLAISNPDALPSTTGKPGITRASILNRNVHIISSYTLCKDILNFSSQKQSDSIGTTTGKDEVGVSPFTVGPAYRELMADWFPPPNLLLEDGIVHIQHKEAWRNQVSSLPANLEPILRRVAKTIIRETVVDNAELDLYDWCKHLAWRLLLAAFLGLDSLDSSKDKSTYADVEAGQEALLRGQFSLFPVAVNTRFWQSPRSKGLRARKEVEQLLQSHIMHAQPTSCPILQGSNVRKDDIASHCLLFTSSIANKALASLLTATLLNLYLMPGSKTLGELVLSQAGAGQRQFLRSILSETERLSPPVVGVMRRVQHDVSFKCEPDQDPYTVPKGHDVWLYLMGASRDPTVFEDADRFQFDRFMHEDARSGFAFGDGAKTCLGSEIVRTMVLIVAEEFLDACHSLQAEIKAPGVRAWLGWEKADYPQVFAKDLKQLPCQRPRDPIMVTISLH